MQAAESKNKTTVAGRIMIVDDDAVIRTGLRGLIKSLGLFEVAGEATNGEDFLAQLPRTDAGFVLLDLVMPGMHGLEVARRAMQIKPELKIIICSADARRDELYKLLDTGIFGFILKTEGFGQTIKALTSAAEGIPYFSPKLVGLVIRHRMPEKNTIQFSPRETEIIGLMCKGYSMNEIAEALFISVRTAEKHRSNMLGKIGKNSTLELVLYALKNEIIPFEEIDYRNCSVSEGGYCAKVSEAVSSGKP